MRARLLLITVRILPLTSRLAKHPPAWWYDGSPRLPLDPLGIGLGTAEVKATRERGGYVVQPVNPHEWREQQTNDETVLPTGTARRFDPWNFKGDSGLPSAQDILGYHVEATDGRIGKIDEVFSAIDGSYV